MASKRVTGSAVFSFGDPVPPRPRTSWRALRVYDYDTSMRVSTSRTYGFRGECSCGWRGPIRGTVALVRLTIHEHRAEAHQ